MKLSILIPTLPEPESITYLKRLTNILNPQVEHFPGQVEIKIHDAGRSMPTGLKRNTLIENSEGEYFVFIDCDDLVPMYYVNEMMKAVRHGPDVVTFVGEMTTNGRHGMPFTIRLGEKYEQRNGRYYRWPNHLCAFKRSVVQDVKFFPIWNQEDYLWSKQINDSKILKTEVHIPINMYHYDYWNNKPAYGPQRTKVR